MYMKVVATDIMERSEFIDTYLLRSIKSYATLDFNTPCLG